MKHNSDDRRDNVDRIQKNINHTIMNMEMADEMIEKTEDKKTKHNLEKKNERRRDALDNMRTEIRDEAIDKEHGYEN